MDNRQAHNQYQRALFRDEVNRFREPTPREVVPRLKRIVELAKLERSDRVLDVGTGTGTTGPRFHRDAHSLTPRTTQDRRAAEVLMAHQLVVSVMGKRIIHAEGNQQWTLD